MSTASMRHLLTQNYNDFEAQVHIITPNLAFILLAVVVSFTPIPPNQKTVATCCTFV